MKTENEEIGNADSAEALVRMIRDAWIGEDGLKHVACGMNLELASVEWLLALAGGFRGGKHELYKPGLALSYCEHDNIARVYVTGCKSCPVEEGRGSCAIVTPSIEGTDCVRLAVLTAILLMVQSGAR